MGLQLKWQRGSILSMMRASAVVPKQRLMLKLMLKLMLLMAQQLILVEMKKRNRLEK